MDINQLIREGFEKLAAGVATQIRVATVTRLDKDKVVCDATLVDTEVEVFDIRLRATDDQTDDGLVVFPQVGSFILIAQIANNGGWILMMCSEIEDVFFKKSTILFSLAEGLLYKKGNDTLAALVADLLDALLQLVVLTAVGPSTGLDPSSLQSLTELKLKFSQLLKDV